MEYRAAEKMEKLYKTVVPRGQVRCMAWSSTNLVAISVSIQTEGRVSENCGKASTHQILVFDPNRPWEFHCVVEGKSVVVQLEWSMDGNRLLALSEDSTIKVHRMKTHCINNWVLANKKEPQEEGDKVIHIAWLDYRPMATIHHAKEDWREVMEFQPFSTQLRMLIGNAFISITKKGKVMVTSTSLEHAGDRESGELCADIALPGVKDIILAKTFVTFTGSVLCAVGLERGQVKVFSLTTSLVWGNEFTLSVQLATELHQMSSVSDKLTFLLMLPHVDGCTVHVCHNDTMLYQWSVKDITRSGSYTSRRESILTFSKPISSIAGSALCLGSHDPSATENKMSELLLGEELEDIKEGDGKWPVEVVVAIETGGEVMVLNRDSYKALLSVKPEPSMEKMDTGIPALKRRRLEAESLDEGGRYLVSLSPSACCVAIANGNSISFYQAGKVILGLKDSSTPEVPQCSRLLSLAAVSYLSPWDLVVTCSRLEPAMGPGFVKKVLDHFTEDYKNHSSTLKSSVIRQFFTICSLLHNTMEDGLLCALTYRRTARLYATYSLLTLALPTRWDDKKTLMDALKEVCSEHSSEDNLESVASNLPTKEFVIPQDVASHLQGHCHWLVEMAVKVVSAITKGTNDTIPDVPALEVLRECIVLLYTWNKSTPALQPISDGALSLLFKVLTTYIQSPTSPLPEELQTELSGNIPEDKHPNLLTLTRAAHLQGFLSGLSTASLPESFQRGMAPRIRPHVQSKYCSPDPYSPLTLVVPEGLSPPWRDCFIEGQKDVLHGGALSKALVQNAKLKQCSRCRSWTLASEGLQSEQLSLSVGGGHPVQQWRTAWTNSCLCGGPWTLRSTKQT